MGVLDGKVAIITGAAMDEKGGVGIGGATAQLMAREGARVVVVDILGDRAKRLAESIGTSGGEALAVQADVSRESEVAAMVAATVEKFGGVDILHNNAAALDPETIGRDGELLSLDVAVWEHTLRVNLTGMMLGCKHAIPHMLKRGRGAIVNTSSIASLEGELYRASYATAKGGINSLTRHVATMYGKQGIRCNAVAPGMVLTASVRAILPPGMEEMMLRHHLTPYLGESEHIAQVVVFLASEKAAFITGELITVDGGLTKHSASYADFMAAAAAAQAKPKG